MLHSVAYRGAPTANDWHRCLFAAVKLCRFPRSAPDALDHEENECVAQLVEQRTFNP